MNIDEIINKSSHFDQKDKKLIKENGVVFTNRTICEPSVGKGAFVFALLDFFR